MPTERLWLTEPRRKTALAQVTAVKGAIFRLDRSLFCPRSRTYRHPQPPDHGVVWTPDGEKRRLVAVFEEYGELWHRLRGAVPAVGDTLQCHLDVERRQQIERAHTAMHLVLATLPRDVGALVADPEVRGGGHFRLDLDVPFVNPKVLSTWRENALRLAARDAPVARTHVSDVEVPHRLAPQPFVDGVVYPGPETTRECVEIRDVHTLPCDGTHLERTGGVKELVVREAHPDGRGGFVVVFRAR